MGNARVQAARRWTFGSRVRRGRDAGLGVALLLALGASPAIACEFNYDNDQYAFRGMDSGYTGGFALACAPRLDDSGATQWRLAVELHTPRRIGWRSPVHGDRPYASLLKVERLVSSVDEAGTVVSQRGLSLGVLGSPALASIQNRWHQLVGYNRRANGWQHQISDGGEPTLLYTNLRQRLWRPGQSESEGRSDSRVGLAERLEIQAVSGFRIGYRTEALVGAIARVGARTRPWWTIAPDASAQAGGGGEPGRYAIAGATLRLVGYDALLQGQFRESAVRLNSSEVVPLVAHAWVRVGVQTVGQVDYSFTLHHESEDTRRALARPLSWGTLSISKSF
jgi:hypothetical protein